MDDLEFNKHLADAAREMAGRKGVVNTLDRAVELATEVVDHCELVGISVVRKDGIETPSASGEELQKIDQFQYELKEGPCYEVLQSDDVVSSNDLSRDARWPEWGTRMAQELGVRSSLSYRLFTTGGTLGALNLYARSTHAFDHHDLLEGTIVAAHAAAALASALQQDHLEHAVTTRTVIGQATGILMERFQVDQDRAFDVLRRVSSHTNTKLHLVAARLVETRALPDAHSGQTHAASP